jgi:protein SCO1/2
MKARILRILFFFSLGLFIAGVVAAYQIKQEESAHGIAVTATDFGGPFTLVNTNNETVTEKEFEGKWRLIYFGFTYCPAICPTELQKMASALNDMGPVGEEIIPIFISVDPERDTVDVMRRYVELFHPRLIGLTGTVQQVEEAKKSYKIYSAKVKDDTMTDYTVDHSSFIYLMNPDDDLVRIFRIEDTAEEIIKITRKAFSAYNNKSKSE